MKFEINSEDWEVKFVDKDTIKNKYNEEYEDGATFVFGLTLYPEHEIWINKDMCNDQQYTTLWHELTHCYLWSFGLKNVPHYTEEMVCDIVAASWSVIRDIANTCYLNKNNS